MLRSKQYKKYHSLKLDQSDMVWFVATRVYNQLYIIKGMGLHEKSM